MFPIEQHCWKCRSTVTLEYLSELHLARIIRAACGGSYDESVTAFTCPVCRSAAEANKLAPGIDTYLILMDQTSERWRWPPLQCTIATLIIVLVAVLSFMYTQRRNRPKRDLEPNLRAR